MINCKNCGKLFTPESKRTKACSYECKKEYGYSIYKNEKEGRYLQDKPIKHKACRQCGETFKTQTNRNYCYKGCTSVLRQGKIINKEQLTIKTATMKQEETGALDFLWEKQPTTDSTTFNINLSAAEKAELKVFNLLKSKDKSISIFSLATLGGCPTAPSLHKDGKEIALPDIFLFKDQRLTFVEVKSKESFFYSDYDNNYTCSIMEHEYKRYEEVQKLTGARITLAFVVKEHKDGNPKNPKGSKIQAGVWLAPFGSGRFWDGKGKKGVKQHANPQYKYEKKNMILLECVEK